MPRVTRLLLVFVLVGAAVMSSITHSPSARAGPVRVLGADVAKMSSYSASSQYPSPSSGRPSSQLQNTKGVFPSRQRDRDYEAILPERKGPANGLLARQGENLDRQYRVVVLKSAPGHPLHQSSGHPEKEEEEEEALRFAGMPSGDAPQRLARRRDDAGGQSAWKTSSVVWSQPGRYASGSRKDADEPTEAFVPRRANVIQPGGFPPRGVNASAEKNPDASLFQHGGPQPEKPTSSLADDGRRATKSFLVKPSFLRREDLGKPWHSPSVSEIEKFERIPKYSRTVSPKEKDHAVHLPRNAGRYPATLREHFPPHLAAQSYREKLWPDAVAPPAPATDTVGATTSRRPARPTPSERAGRLLGSKRSKWPASKAFASRGKSYGLKMANVYPSLSSKYSFGQRKAEPRTTAAPSAIGFPRPQNLERRPLKQPSHRLEGANTAARPSNGSAALQVFRALDQNALQFASTSPIPETFGTERNETRSERRLATGPTAARDGSEGAGRRLVEGGSRLFGTSAGSSSSSTVRGTRVHASLRGGPVAVAGNSPIVRRPKRPQGELAGNATATPTAAAALPNLTKSGVGFSGSGVPLPTSPETTLQSQKNTQRDEESSASEVFDDGTDETLQEDLLELTYLRISTGNVSFKSI
ncbi:uncharacterized protein LOC109508367 isoform X2 [Hippocampus comes]|uniref:uncharacterized protein LOC109508367 isoform X2 n=1 Tax=Hippocampus comes TaxID=109280 RepID=UPI00094E79CC|nr:PREDICTED: uncharacterized protein LOC109508367 isoform X2 [Hippocampus comes]